jgi:hypothetical protein
VTRAAILTIALLLTACDAPHDAGGPEPPPRVVGWRHLASWSGRGNTQTETFMSDNGSFRIQWATSHESAPGTGMLKVAFRSGDSGRVIIDAVDQKGEGSGSAEVGDMVRWYYLSIDSANVDWKVSVEEPIMGKTVEQ